MDNDWMSKNIFIFYTIENRRDWKLCRHLLDACITKGIKNNDRFYNYKLQWQWEHKNYIHG